ncbi:MAG TPA: hypothetical protein VFI56_21410 [Vicinamibacterales bacterium]|nr:hypothetical protein [Vicinamibacterales bacterium]
MTRLSRWCLASLFLAAAHAPAFGQTARAPVSPSHIVIPFLANAGKPAALEFESAECDVDSAGTSMDCIFQQLFLTTSEVAPDTCLVTTNRYQRVFQRDPPNRWISKEGPDGVCGSVDMVTLQDGGGVRWTMETRRIATAKDAAPSCRAPDGPPEILSWQNVRRPLPCRFVQPGGLSR